MIYGDDPTPFRGCVDLTPPHGIKRPSRMAIRLANITAHVEGLTLRLPWVADIIGAQTKRNIELRAENLRLVELVEDQRAWLTVLSLSCVTDDEAKGGEAA